MFTISYGHGCSPAALSPSHRWVGRADFGAFSLHQLNSFSQGLGLGLGLISGKFTVILHNGHPLLIGFLAVFRQVRWIGRSLPLFLLVLPICGGVLLILASPCLRLIQLDIHDSGNATQFFLRHPFELSLEFVHAVLGDVLFDFLG